MIRVTLDQIVSELRTMGVSLIKTERVRQPSPRREEPRSYYLINYAGTSLAWLTGSQMSHPTVNNLRLALKYKGWNITTRHITTALEKLIP